jgi:RNA recognition motif-containing protein
MLIGNLPLDTSEEELYEFFGAVGKVGGVEILKDKTGRGRGFAFVTMVDQKQKQEALAVLHNSEFKGRVLSVSPAKTSPQPKSKGFFFGMFGAV